jgi:hypothetical protein
MIASIPRHCDGDTGENQQPEYRRRPGGLQFHRGLPLPSKQVRARALAVLDFSGRENHAMIDVAKRSGRPVGDYSAGAWTDNAIGELDRELDLVKTDQHGDHALARNVPQNRKNALGRFRIEAGDRLVGQDKSGSAGRAPAR